MAANDRLPDPSEPDLYWSGQSGFAMLPGLVAGVVVSIVLMLGLPPLGEWINLREDWIAFIRFWLVLVGWLTLGLVWSYRGAAFVYRLTPSRLYLDFGILVRPVTPIPLAAVTKVECRAWALRRLFRVGSVIVYSQGREPVRLRGIFRPELFAKAIELAAQKARGERRVQ